MKSYVSLFFGVMIGILVNHLIIKPIERKKIRREILEKQNRENEVVIR